MTQPNLAEWLARKPAGKKPRKPVKKVSGKRDKQLREYSKRRKVFLEDRPLCEAWPVILDWAIRKDISERGTALEGIPNNRPEANQVHHKNSRVGEKLNNTKYWLAVGNWAHRWIHSHPRESRALKLLF